MQAEIIAIGSELLGPHRLDTNSLYLTDQLNRLGIEVCRKTVIGDDQRQIADAVEAAMKHSQVVMAMGGLGPTSDDVTREAVAGLLGRRLVRDDRIVEAIERRFRTRGMRMPEINLRQAMLIEGAEMLPNSAGTAPGQWIREGGRIVVLLPGVPAELRAIFNPHCRERLEQLAPGRVLLTRVLKIAGLFESQVDEIAAPIYRKFENPATTILASPGEIQLHLRATGSSEAEAHQALNELSRQLEIALGDVVFSQDGQTLEEVVGMYLTMKGKTLAVAESCTGGLLAERITRVPGSSRYFLGGVVAYHNEVKARFLEVSNTVLQTAGAVSAETARLMAESARHSFGADFALSITGIAGPQGGTPQKPVGLVYLALAEAGAPAQIVEKHYLGDRERVRLQASQTALDMLRLRIRN
jgi:nicotinamide-nucleotide amidase